MPPRKNPGVRTAVPAGRNYPHKNSMDPREPIRVLANLPCADPQSTLGALPANLRQLDAVALAFDLLHAGDDIRRRPLIERKKELKWVLRNARDGIQYVEHTEGDGAEMFEAVCKLGLEGIVSKRATSVYKSGSSKTWIKVKNPKSSAATRVLEGVF